MSNQKSVGATTPKKEAGNTKIVAGVTGKMFQDGKLKIPEQKPATPVTATIDPEVRAKVNGGIDVAGEKKSKPKKMKAEAKKVSHPVVADLERILPDGWTSAEKDGYNIISDDEGKMRMHARNGFTIEYFPVRLLTEPKVRKITTGEELEALITEVQKPVETKTKKSAKEGQ